MTDIHLPKGGWVVGVGTDIVEVERIRKAHERFQERFLSRVFTEEESRYCLGKSDPYPYLAARFAAKEAVSKAFTTGIGEHLSFTSISVCNGERGQPFISPTPKLKELLKAVGAGDVLISLSHIQEYAIATAVLVK